MEGASSPCPWVLGVFSTMLGYEADRSCPPGGLRAGGSPNRRGHRRSTRPPVLHSHDGHTARGEETPQSTVGDLLSTARDRSIGTSGTHRPNQRMNSWLGGAMPVVDRGSWARSAHQPIRCQPSASVPARYANPTATIASNRSQRTQTWRDAAARGQARASHPKG